MACKTSFELHHNFAKLAEESGFTFNTHKPRVHIEWNRIKLIDIESLIKDRKFVIVEQHINDILDCVLESEFDVRILDKGVLKIFRLAQLAVEYQQFCRHYLDRSVYVLRQEVTNLLKELDTTKKNLQDKEEEIRKVKRKNKQYIRNPLPYGNENIATMLLRTLNQNHGDVFGTSSQLDVTHYNKCTYCEKIFLNQLYLKSHISRRHANVDVPQKDTEDKNVTNDFGSSKVNEEIAELKLQLKQMEKLITNTHNNHDKNMVTADTQTPDQNNSSICNNEKICKEMKDAEVLTNDDTYMLNKIEEWKKKEFDKYNNELNLLRNQIIDIVSNKEKQEQSMLQNELRTMEQLQMTIKQQGDEIIGLKQELLKEENSEKEKRKEIETQISYWIKQTETQSNEYKALLQKLDDVANEAKEYRARADAEKERSSKLEEMLQGRLRKQNFVVTDSPHNSVSKSIKNKNQEDNCKVTDNTKILQRNTTTPIRSKADANTLKKLQQKAHELLNIDQPSSTDISSASDDKTHMKLQKKDSKREKKVDNSPKYDITTNLNIVKPKEKRKGSKILDETSNKRSQRTTSDKIYDEKSKFITKVPKKGSNERTHVPCSPMKVIRAKITEGVNHHLTSLGVDPFKNRLPQNIFEKQRALLQREREMKAKKFPAREKILHSIITTLDQNTRHTNIIQEEVYVSPNKPNKMFKLSSVLTNVKTKALSFVKSNEPINKSERSYNDVAKRAIALLETPTGSAHSSPFRSEIDITPDKAVKNTGKAKKEVTYNQSHIPTKRETKIYEDSNTNDDSDSTAGDEELAIDGTTKVNHIVKSPVRLPSSNDTISKEICKKTHLKSEMIYKSNEEESSNEIESIEMSPKKYFSEENINSPKQSKGVLKNASSTSSLNKKKVLFDMEAIQMKSVSASPSQSVTDKSGNNDGTFESRVTNLDNEEWDISSIENEPSKSATKIQITSHTSPKIAELKKTIESKLAYRNPTLSTALVGGIDVLATPIQKGTSFGGSNTSLGSSILDETDNLPVQNNTFLIKSKTVENEDSDIEISDLINDAVDNKRYIKSF